MNNKIVVQVALLAVVGVSVVAWAWKSFAKETAAAPPAAAPAGNAGGTPAAPGAQATPAVPVATAPGEVLADGVAVINFHGTRR